MLLAVAIVPPRKKVAPRKDKSERQPAEHTSRKEIAVGARVLAPLLGLAIGRRTAGSQRRDPHARRRGHGVLTHALFRGDSNGT